MASTIRTEDLDTFRRILETLEARLKGDLSQMTDEALKRNQPDASGSHSNMPLHMADLGTENYDQEFTLSLIANEQATLDQIQEAIQRIDRGGYGECDECGNAIARARLQALPYTRYCIECARRLENA